MRLPIALVLLSSPALAQPVRMPPPQQQQQPQQQVVQPAPQPGTSAQLQATATTLLDGRIAMKLPIGMQISQPPQGTEPMHDETRAELTLGQLHLMVVAEELYATAPGDLVAAVTQIAKGEKPEPVAIPSGLKVVGFQPQHGPPPGDMNLLYAAWLVHPDGHVIQVGFLGSSLALQQRASWIALVQSMLQTLTPGTKKLALEGGEHTFGAATGDKLVMHLPGAWTTSSNQGPDFVVYHLKKISALGSPSPTCGIYVGAHPNTFRTRMNGQGTLAQGVLLGQRADWFSFQGQRGDHTTEAVVPNPLQTSQWIHVFCTAPTEAELKPARAAVDTLRIVR